ncbi:beta-propeller fold lactonase family protein [Variovorax sp. J22R133]|uniref:lactonase family protein n=1 Tax=Variovorax brevis TaxID=3053503 RepID=UPI002574CB03|nr:beta-propeller fold lactonase family protein [Variovorax sp. J22R133]MDM0113419.1 beta-propeller fold lactonase family protein [Variovorax sp. J22R133]
MFAVYVSNSDSGDISVLRLDPAQGTLTPIQSMAVGGAVMPMALSPKRDRLYAVRRSEPHEALSFAIDPRSGELRALGAGALPQSMAYASTDRSGRYLFTGSYGGHQIAVNTIDADGVAGATQQVLPTGQNAHAIVADPSNRFVFVPCLGGRVVMQFDFDAATGRLTPHKPAAFAPHDDASPRHLVFSPDARFVYLLNELDGTVDVLAFDSAAGTLSTVQTISAMPPAFSDKPWAADIHLTPDGRFLYTCERRSNTIAAFRVDAASGTLSLIGHVDTEAQPRGFNVTPDGRFLIASGQLSDRLRLYAIDPQSGALSVLGDAPAGKGANWVETLALVD